MLHMFPYLSLAEKLVVIALGVSCVVILSSAAAIVGGRLVRTMTRKPAAKPGRWTKWRRRITLALAGLLIACGVYSFYEPYRLEVTHVTVSTAKLPAGARPIRIVHISDTHCDGRELLEDDLPEIIAGLRPDVICFTGDALNSRAGLPRFQELMTKLDAIAPTFAVYGNWGHPRRRNGDDYFGPTGVELLEGRPVRLLVGGQAIWLTGTRTYFGESPDDVAQALAGVPLDEPVIFLHHMPSIILNLPGRGVDLCLTGHTHGGQVALPFYGALATLASTGKRFEAGLYQHDDVTMYVSRGVGVEGHGLPRIRFLARPEVTLIELVGQP